MSAVSLTPTIVILAALDTKGVEAAFLKEQIEARAARSLIVDLGIQGMSAIKADVSRQEVARAAGEEIEVLAHAGDRGKAVGAMTRGVETLMLHFLTQGRIQGAIGIGGSAGTAMATAAMRALPLGIPKVMVSTVAGGDVRPFVGLKDIVMIPSIVDISGLNRISRQVLAQASAAVCAMAHTEVPQDETLPLIAASMFGNTTPCVEAARAHLESCGFEVLVFHATGTGGQTMEGLIEAGYITAVLDVTTTELADELVGGVMSAGPTRLEAAARAGVPAVVAPGCLDMVNFWGRDTVPEKYQDRLFYQHNPNVTLMRTTPEENWELGRKLADKLNSSVGSVAVYLPLRGVSMISAPGQPFYFPEADQALFDSIKRHLRADISVCELDVNINDPAFARRVGEGLLQLLQSEEKRD